MDGWDCISECASAMLCGANEAPFPQTGIIRFHIVPLLGKEFLDHNLISQIVLTVHRKVRSLLFYELLIQFGLLRIDYK